MSNYPPGVSGMEWEIAGPDFETTGRHYCPDCERETDGLFAGFRHERWWTCDDCYETVDLEVDQ